ncbi:hypothetical protein BGZ96_010919 [Linnemannia gamsii]|uniref:Myb-like domain-containing protein n=1 Tax=Linnemannia gamsii TaxID=64522 RepID=A0ABQ7JTW5_9FUNG|nr:hypothetical protein BGZ96_010919 [Linnemannia gamsii]
MATFFRASSVTNTRLTLITDAFTRFRLQRAGSLLTSGQPSQLRFITQTGSNLKSLTGADLSTTIKRDHSSPKHASTNGDPQSPVPEQIIAGEEKVLRAKTGRLKRSWWTVKEDRELYQLVKEGKNSGEIHSSHFQFRTSGTVAMRVGWARKAIKVQDQQARNGVRPEEIDIAKAVAGEKGSPLLRTVYLKLNNEAKTKRQEDENTVQRPYALKNFSSRKRKWTAEEETLLRQLVEKNSSIPLPKIWKKVSGGDIDGSVLHRSVSSCSRHWVCLHPSSSALRGVWTKKEELRLQKAISKQLEGKYQVAVDVLMDKPVTTENFLRSHRLELQQLLGQEGLPVLKVGSHRLRCLSWAVIANKVKSRTAHACGDHFYKVYHNGVRGRWSKEELRRMKEGQEMFGRDSWKIAEHVGTRAPSQVNGKMIRMTTRYTPEAEKDTNEAVASDDFGADAAGKGQ